MQLLDRLPQLLEAHGNVLYPVVGVVVLLAVGAAFFLRLSEPTWSPDELWQVKKDAVRILEDNHLGLTCEEAAAKLAVPPRHLKVVLEQLIQDRFVVAEAEKGETVFKLKRFQGGSYS